MKNVILISDKEIQEKLEDRVIALALTSISMSLNDAYEAFYFKGTGYFEVAECGCDEGAMKAAFEARRKLEAKLANEQIKKNMEAKKKFESGELDENSEYYKKIIRPYEVHIKTPFVTGVIGPYKSGWTVNIGHDKLGSVDFSKMQQHIRNTTTYDGGIEVKVISAEAGGFGAEVSITGRCNVTSGPEKSFSVSDMDFTGGAKADLSAPGLVNATTGFSISSVRGSKLYGNIGFSGDSLLDEDLKMALGNWKPDLVLNVWEGEYNRPSKK
jgi:hypothetical protein